MEMSLAVKQCILFAVTDMTGTIYTVCKQRKKRGGILLRCIVSQFVPTHDLRLTIFR